MATETDMENFHLSGSPTQSSPNINSEDNPQRPSTPPNLSKNQAKKWRKNWDYEERQRKKNSKMAVKSNAKAKTIKKQMDNPLTKKKSKKARLVERISIDSHKRISMFAHLSQSDSKLHYISPSVTSLIHPLILRSGLYYLYGTVWGANARCIIMLNAFLSFIESFEHCTSRELLLSLNQSIQFLNDCRTQSVSMGNTIRWLKMTIINCSDDKAAIIDCIKDYIYMHIETADLMIIQQLIDRICDGDILLTYARSYVVEKAIIRAYNEGKQFKLIVVDSRPHFEGKSLLEALSGECPRLDIQYTLLNSASYVMSNALNKINKVILGAACVMSNGSVVSRCGTAQIALIAKHYKIPVLVCCETYKFSQRVQIDSICTNELADFDALLIKGKQKERHITSDPIIDASDTDLLLRDWRNIPKLKMLNLKYDTTPAKLINMVVTELGVMPPSAAPVILRESKIHQNSV